MAERYDSTASDCCPSVFNECAMDRCTQMSNLLAEVFRE